MFTTNIVLKKAKQKLSANLINCFKDQRSESIYRLNFHSQKTWISKLCLQVLLHLVIKPKATLSRNSSQTTATKYCPKTANSSTIKKSTTATLMNKQSLAHSKTYKKHSTAKRISPTPSLTTSANFKSR